MDQPQATAASQNNVELPFDLKHDESKNSESAINIEDRQMDTDTHRLNQSENSEGFLAGLKLRQQMGIEPARKTKAPKEVRDAMAKKFYCLRVRILFLLGGINYHRPSFLVGITYMI